MPGVMDVCDRDLELGWCNVPDVMVSVLVLWDNEVYTERSGLSLETVWIGI